MVRGFFVARASGDIAQPGLVVAALALSKHARHSGSAAAPAVGNGEMPMRKLLLIVGFLALAIGLLWIGQGTGVIDWPASSFMIRQIQWAGYGAALAAFGLVLIWQGKR
jgi:hypothetical protein